MRRICAATCGGATCADGGNFDLLNPRVEDVSFAVICEHLAKANRYCGATPGKAYSVAQHSVLCAKASLVATGDHILAAYCLCHDMHEAFLGDDTTPKKRALAAIIGGFGVLASAVNDAFAALTDRIDTIIHARAGLARPPSPDMSRRASRGGAPKIPSQPEDQHKVDRRVTSLPVTAKPVAAPQSLTAAIMGDPPPGRSALDQRQIARGA